MSVLPPTRSATEALEVVADGAHVVAGCGCGTPTTLLSALGGLARAERRWTLSSGLQLGDPGFVTAVAEGRLAYRTWHVVKETADLVASGRADFVPLRGSQVPSVLARWGVDHALIRVSPPDAAGEVSLGTSPSYPWSLVRTARHVIAEIDPTMPRTHGRTRIPVSAIDVLVESEQPTPLHLSRPPDEVSRRIAATILPLLPHDPVLQMGIGAVPEAMTELLADADLGRPRFVGMGNDGMVELLERGVLGPIDPSSPAIVALELMGSRRLLDAAHDNPAITAHPVEDEGVARRLARFDRFVSINSAVEIDLSGQVNAEWMRGRQVSGTGGSIDFVEAAAASEGGLRILALPSLSAGHSRIVERLEDTTPVTLSRQSVDVVVTEHGIARLAGLSLRERREALIAIAAPEHRDALADGDG